MVEKVTPNPLTGSRNDIAASRQFVGTGADALQGRVGGRLLRGSSRPDGRDRHLQVQRRYRIPTARLGDHGLVDGVGVDGQQGIVVVVLEVVVDRFLPG